ncbi:MAG: heat-shock protein [Mariprofundaceae bacterium]|nr:heat-shock protein [Mariprofundaceae bacterium]
MNSVIVIFLAVAGLVSAALLWRNKTGFSDDMDETQAEDIRVSPLLRGINFLLSDQPDQALQEMVQVAKIRSEAADVYMALGEMFRAQGEYGRAVRIHQNLLARPDVPLDLHFQAYVSLGRDFQAGGLLDRALRHYAKALAMQPDHLESLRACLRIREQSHEWTEAEWLVSRLEQIEAVSYHEHRAYLYAEMAKGALLDIDLDTCEAHLTAALDLSTKCGHAHLLRMESLMQQQKWDDVLAQAASFLAEVAEQHQGLLPHVLMLDASFYSSKAEGFLWDAWQSKPDVELGLCWIESLAEHQGAQAALTLQAKLNLQDLSLRHELRLLALSDEKDNLIEQAKQWRLSKNNYACKQCGVQVHDMRWQCPKCNTWGSMMPLQTSLIFGGDE